MWKLPFRSDGAKESQHKKSESFPRVSGEFHAVWVVRFLFLDEQNKQQGISD